MSSSTTFSSKLFPVIAVATLVATAFVSIWLQTAIAASGGWGILADHTRVALSGGSKASYMKLGRGELEAGRVQKAIADSTKACGTIPTDNNCTELLGASFAVAGGHDAELASLMAVQTSVEARSALEKLGGSQTTKAQELYVLGLLRSSRRIAATISLPSVPYYLLEARLNLALDGSGGVGLAEANIKKALALDPASQMALEQALVVSHQTGNALDIKNYENRLNAITNN